MLSASLISRAIIVVFLSSTLAIDVKNEKPGIDLKKTARFRPEGPPRTLGSTKNASQFNSTSELIDTDDQPRDKRALGTILQGLAEVLGYTPSPISLASLPNPNPTASAAAAAPPTIFTFPGIAPAPATPAAPPAAPPRPSSPPPIPQRPVAPSTMPPMTTQRRETLRLTGVLNFGNNSDLLGHLQQYERLFHGGGTTTAAPPPAPQTTTSGPAKLGLLPPFFVKIPLPIAPNLPPLLPPTAPRKLPQQTGYAMSVNEENYERESDEIQDEKDVRVEPPNRDTYIDEPEWMKKQRESQRNNYKEENESGESEQNGGSNESRERPVEQSEDSKKGEREEEDDEEESEEEDDERKDYRQDERNNREENDEEDSEERYERKKPAQEYTNNHNGEDSGDYDEDDDERDDHKRREVLIRDRNNLENPVRTTLSNYNEYVSPLQFSPLKLPPVSQQFGTRLPIRVLDVPYQGHHEFLNSYGQSLQHEGQIDESVADYFERYKHPDTGLFDSRKIERLEAARKRDPWWHQDYPEVRRNQPIIRQEYGPNARLRYEEYKLEPERKRFSGRKKNSKSQPEIFRQQDEQAEPTVTTYALAKAPKAKRKYVIKKENDTKEDDKEASREATATEENDDSIENKKSLKVKGHNLSRPALFKGFDFIKYSPYFKPLQIEYEPEKLQRTADHILSYHNFGRFGDGGVGNLENKATEENDEEDDGPVAYTDDKNAIKPEIATSGEAAGEQLSNRPFNPYDSYVRPIRYEYKPESLQKTAERIASYQNVGKSKDTPRENHQKGYENEKNNESEANRSPDNLREEDDEQEVNRSPENLREGSDDEPEDNRSPENLRQKDDAESEDNRSPENLRQEDEDEEEDNRSSENLRQGDDNEEEADDSSENLRQEDDDESEADRSSENLREEDDYEPEVNIYSVRSEEEENDEPEANRYSSILREADSSEEDKPEVDDSSENLREQEDSVEDKPEVNRASKKVQKNYAIPEVGLPERLTGRKLHEGEYKEKNLWPAPFDYTFDSTESTKIVANDNSSETSDEIVEPTNETPAIVKKYSSRIVGRRNPQRASPTRETPSNDELQKSPRTGSRAPDSDVAPTRESSFYEKYSRFPANGASNSDAKRVSERSRNLSEAKRYRDPEVTRNRKRNEERLGKIAGKSLPVEKSETFEDPESAHEFFGLSKDDYNLDPATGERRSKEKMATNNTTTLTTNPKELLGLLIVRHEDPDYKRDVNLTEFTDKPESDTEKVRVKEYRNKIATISVTERKQLSPNGPVQLIGFTRNF